MALNQVVEKQPKDLGSKLGEAFYSPSFLQK